MAKSVRVEPQVIQGFEAHQADAALYRAVAKGTAERFGIDTQAYKTIMNGINPNNGTGSQFFFHTEAGLYLPKGQRVIRVDDLGRINDADPSFFNGIYTDTPELVLRTATPSWKTNAKILENLVVQARERDLEFSSDNPLVLSGLELVRDDNEGNPYGILVQIGDQTTTTNDSRFAYGTDTIKLGNQSKTLWTKEEGLSGVCLDRNGVYSDNDTLQDSSDYGRVVVFDAEGVAA